jgi:SAM-dependent methyltransferase
MTVLKVVTGVAALGLAGATAVLYAGFGAFLPWREAAEAERLAALAGVRAGQTVAEIGAGGGRFTVAMATRVGEAGRVYSTELDEARRADIRTRADAAGLRNVTVVEGAPHRTNLPDGCCDVVFMRNVYHHVQDPEAFAASVRRAVRPNGRVVVMDFDPGSLWFHGGRPDGASDRRPGHGVSRAAAIAEFRAAGFRLEHEAPRWSQPMWLVMFRPE